MADDMMAPELSKGLWGLSEKRIGKNLLFDKKKIICGSFQGEGQYDWWNCFEELRDKR